MRLPLHARSPNSAAPLLIAAISGRALAAAARRAGYRPLVADFFEDADTRRLAARTAVLPGNLRDGIDGALAIETLGTLAEGEQPAALVLGSGFERKPDLVDEIARHFPLVGNAGATIRRIKDPAMLAADCAELNIPHPEIHFDRPADPENWLVKTAGAAGGAHIRQANRTDPEPAGQTEIASAPADGGKTDGSHYYQRLLHGESISALFVADGRGARVVGYSRQWTSPTPSQPYRYGGAARLRRFGRRDAASIGAWLSGLTGRTGLRGLCSADLIKAGGSYHLIEINPRPGATLDIFDGFDAPLMEAHLRASRGEHFRLPVFADSMAQLIAYAEAPVAKFPAIDWPDGTADHQSEGTGLSRGDPVCTLFANGSTVAAARKAVRQKLRALRPAWQGGDRE